MSLFSKALNSIMSLKYGFNPSKYELNHEYSMIIPKGQTYNAYASLGAFSWDMDKVDRLVKHGRQFRDIDKSSPFNDAFQFLNSKSNRLNNNTAIKIAGGYKGAPFAVGKNVILPDWNSEEIGGFIKHNLLLPELNSSEGRGFKRFALSNMTKKDAASFLLFHEVAHTRDKKYIKNGQKNIDNLVNTVEHISGKNIEDLSLRESRQFKVQTLYRQMPHEAYADNVAHRLLKQMHGMTKKVTGTTIPKWEDGWYHGSNKVYDSMSISKMRKTNVATSIDAAFFTSDPEFANQYTGAYDFGSIDEAHAAGVTPNNRLVQVRYGNAWDHRNPEHRALIHDRIVNKKIAEHIEKNKLNPVGTRPINEYAVDIRKSTDMMLKHGSWRTIEEEFAHINRLGFDAVKFTEQGKLNLAVFNNNQIRNKFNAAEQAASHTLNTVSSVKRSGFGNYVSKGFKTLSNALR